MIFFVSIAFRFDSKKQEINHEIDGYFLTSLVYIHQGTVDNNLGPDRLAGPKALDPNYCRQPTL